MNAIELSQKLVQIQLENEEDPFQQGYLAAPIIAESYGYTAEDLANAIDNRVSFKPSDHQRDLGALKWCREQSK